MDESEVETGESESSKEYSDGYWLGQFGKTSKGVKDDLNESGNNEDLSIPDKSIALKTPRSGTVRIFGDEYSDGSCPRWRLANAVLELYTNIIIFNGKLWKPNLPSEVLYEEKHRKLRNLLLGY